MNYELAKELKDAGFPQDDPEQNLTDYAYFPTLEDLIGACGKDFYSVVRALQNDWRAFSERDEANTIATADGSTPTEAVARLWLALNKKS